MRDVVIAALLGSCGAWGLGYYFIRRWLEKRLESAEDVAVERRAQAKERYRLNDMYMHCIGRLLFWIVHGLKKFDPDHKYFNGELQKAFEDMTNCKRNIKELDRKQLADINEE